MYRNNQNTLIHRFDVSTAASLAASRININRGLLLGEGLSKTGLARAKTIQSVLRTLLPFVEGDDLTLEALTVQELQDHFVAPSQQRLDQALACMPGVRLTRKRRRDCIASDSEDEF